MKDNFSKQSASYRAFRPVYPEELYEFIFSKVNNQQTAWDCACGNGQVAERLARDFKRVVATDLSQKQIDKAPVDSKVEYGVGQAVHHDFQDHSFDLITVAQALHWFQGEEFFKSALNALKPGGVLACWGYGLQRGSEAFNQVMDTFYHQTLKGYWDDERKWIDKH